MLGMIAMACLMMCGGAFAHCCVSSVVLVKLAIRDTNDSSSTLDYNARIPIPRNPPFPLHPGRV